MDNVFNIEALNYSVNFTGKHVTGNLFTFGKRLMDNIAYNSDFVIMDNFLIAQNDNISDLRTYIFVINK